MDIIAAYREVGTYRGAAQMCGTTHKTVKRVIERAVAGGTAAERNRREHNYDVVADLVAEKGTRPVPIPPELAVILRAHIKRFGVGDDGRLFRTRTGGLISGSACSKIWKEARSYACTPDQVASPLAARPYDLRHAAVSLWLNTGVHAPEAAERAGHEVDVMLRIYAKCIDGQREVANQRILDALAV
jgi:integrase